MTAGRGHVEVDDLCVRFGAGPGAHLAVDAVSLEVRAGEFVCLLGPSGCGKSTVLNCVAGYLAPERGRVLLDGAAVTGPGPDRGMVFQQYSLLPWKTVLDNVAFGPLMGGHSRRDSREIARRYLDMVGLGPVAGRYPAALSGGMQQRVGIARALANQPSVLLMDEPFGALDAQTRVLIQESLLRLWSRLGNTCLFVTHDVDEAIFLADRVVVMSAAPGRVLLDLSVDLPRPRTPDVYVEPLFMAYKKQCFGVIREQSLRAFEMSQGAGI